MTVGEILDRATKELMAAGLDEPRRQARRLLAAALGLSPSTIFARPERRLIAAEQARVADMLRRMAAHEPLSRIAGRREFWGLEFLLSPDTLDPRPDSEAVVEAVLDRMPARDRAWRFLDFGTGTGCLLLALLSDFPEASGIGVDIAPGAARTARHNADRLGFAERARFIVGDWGRALSGEFDVIVANPPYIASAELASLPPEVRDYDPVKALDGGGDGLVAYRAIAADLTRLLAADGIFAAEIGLGQAQGAAAILEQAGLRIEAMVPDLAGIERCLVARPARLARARTKAQKKVGMPVRPD